MKASAIGWTDFSGGAANFVLRGSTPGDCEVSAGCENCYMLALHERFKCLPECTTYYPAKLEKLANTRFPKWSPKRGEGHRPMVFVADGGDLFHEDVPEEFIVEALDVMRGRQDVIWQILTKRPARMQEIVWLGTNNTNGEWHLADHIWLGVTAENQAMADERIPLLLDTPAAVRFVSVEPMLEKVDLWGARYRRPDGSYTGAITQWPGPKLDWVIVGGESGPQRRPFDPEWAVDVYLDCLSAGVPFWGKQDSGLRPGVPLVLPDIGEVKEWPDAV